MAEVPEMSILVTGSIAIDHVMVFQDRFKNHILPDRVHMLNVAFHVPTLEKSWGGCAGNIAYNLRQLGADPILLGTVGQDFGEYAEWLDRHGIRRDCVRVLDDAFTAQAFITTDLDDNQIIAFHPGAMDRAHEAGVDAVGETYAWAIVAPNGKQAMQEHARALKARGARTVIDPGQGLPLFEGPELLELIEGAAVFVANDYEWALTLEKTGLSEQEIANRVDALVVTLGERGAWVRQGADKDEIPAVKAERVVDPTGCGDALRAGLLHGLASGRPLATAARMGVLMGALKVAEARPQGLRLDVDAFRARYAQEFGAAL